MNSPYPGAILLPLMFQGIDLYSDTMTRPSEAMKRAMFQAPLGDEQIGEDPTTRELEHRVAALLGKECALFLPSATMANQIALLLHCNRGEELIAAENAHIFFAEAGGPALWAGVLARPIETPTGIFTGAQVRAKASVRLSYNSPITRAVALENTTNWGGGRVWQLSQLQDVWSTCDELNLACHLDGSRLFNAATAAGEKPSAMVAGFDTVTLCFSKGLGCAAGAALAFESRHWDTIRRWKQAMGGSFRQSGILSAGALFGLENNLPRLHEDHAHARKLAEGLEGLEGLTIENPEPDSNMVFYRLTHPRLSVDSWTEQCAQRGFRFSVFGPDRFRAVTHLGVSNKDIETVIRGVREILAAA